MKALKIKKAVLLFLLFTGMVNAQIVNIPDPAFKAKLLEADVTNAIASDYYYYYNSIPSQFIKIDINNDGEIQYDEAQLVKYLDVSSSNIASLEGISSFSNLQHLYCAENQITNIDITGITDLRYLNCSRNQLSFLDVSQNINLTYLACSINQLTHLDVSNNINLEDFTCNNNQITSLDFSQNLYLKSIYCPYNNITNIDVSQCLNLYSLACAGNSISNLDLTNNISLTNLHCPGNLLTSLNVSQNLNLNYLYFDFNQVSSIDLSNNLYLINLWCNNNQFSNLDVSQNLILKSFLCYNNQLTNLDVSQNINLEELSCYNNLLTSLDVSNDTALTTLVCGNNPLNSLDVSNLINLHRLECFSNNLTNLNLTNLINLKTLVCGSNLFTTLDLSHQKKLVGFNCDSSLLTMIDLSQMGIDNSGVEANTYRLNDIPTLTYVNLKNNRPISSLTTSLSNNLAFICADENNISLVQSFLLLDDHNNVQVNSYCNFTPGGNFNTISGNIKYDGNNNGCDVNDLPQPNIRININDGANTGATFTNSTGNYNFYTQVGTFDLNLDIENPTWFNFSPTSATIPFANNNNNTATQDFCISTNGIHNDLEVVVSPITPARPGFDAIYNIVYKNKGNQTLSGNVSFTYDDAVLDFVSATVVPSSQITGNLSWNYATLLPFESKSIFVRINVNSPTETPAVNIGDVLSLNAVITPIAADEIPADNSFSYNQTVVGAFDPNNITCLEGTSVSPTTIGDYLHYAINFENTGNYQAENIVVKTTIDPAKFDINSLQLLNTSNPVEARITGNVVEFIFKTIHLATGGHGHILLKMRSKGTLVEGDSVSKRADIFFDYNAPIDTGLVNTVFESLSNSIVALDDSVNVYPNPTSSIININCNSTIKSIELFDIQGRILVTKIVDDSQSNLDISTYSNGVYFVKITTEKGSKVEKVIKE